MQNYCITNFSNLNIMNRIIFRLLRYSGLPIFFRELIQKNKVTILLLHDINRNTAEKVFTHLMKKYNIIELDEYIQAVNNNTRLPQKSMIITFDDGHIQNYGILPLLKSLNIPVTIFLCASIVNTNRHFWFKYESSLLSIPALKTLSNKARIKALLNEGFKQDKDYNTAQALQKNHIEEMRELVNFQSHTLFHPILPKCNDNEAKEEILNSKISLEDDYGLNITAISYPNGDYSEREIRIAKEVGYKCGITVDYGFNTLTSDLFRLKRLSVNDTDDINELIVKASGLWAFLKTRFGHRQEYGYTNQTE